MLSVPLPSPTKYEESEKNTGRFIIEGCYPGYGTTLGNSLRRTLLSSLPGNAAISVKIKGTTHEFTTINGVMEDVVQIILNLKRTRFKLNGVDEATIFLKVKGEKEVTAENFKSTSSIEVVNTDQHIATLASASAELDMEVKVERGLGYVPVEQQEREEKEVGTIGIDAVYTPIKRVNFMVDNMRVGKRTDFDRITLDVVTDGSITPQEAFVQTVEVLMAQYNAISSFAGKAEETEEEVNEEKKEESEEEESKKKKPENEGENTPISELNLSTRTLNVLNEAKIEIVSEISGMTEAELDSLEGMGDKGIKEIKKAIGTLGIILKATE